MSILLLVRSADDVRSAVNAASAFLVYQRRQFAAARDTDDVLGIWLNRELDAHLPGCLSSHRDIAAGFRGDAAGRDGFSARFE